MAYDYSEVIEAAKEAIEEYGRDVVFVKQSQVPSNPDKPWLGSGGSQITQAASAVFVPASGSDLGIESVTDEMLSRVEEVCIVGQTPQDIGDFGSIVDSSVTYKVEWAQTLKPANDIILYVFGVKR